MSNVIPGAEFDRDPASLSPEELKAPPLPDNEQEPVPDVLGAFEEYGAHCQSLLTGNASIRDRD